MHGVSGGGDVLDPATAAPDPLLALYPAPPPPEHTDLGLFFGTLAAFAGTVGLFGWGMHAAGAANR